MIVSDVSKRVLLVDDAKHAESIKKQYMRENKTFGVKVKQIDLALFEITIIYNVGDYYHQNRKLTNDMILSGEGLRKL